MKKISFLIVFLLMSQILFTPSTLAFSQPDITVKPTCINLSSIPAGSSSSPKTVTIKNDGTIANNGPANAGGVNDMDTLPTRIAPQLWYLDSETTPAGREMEKSTSPGNDGQAGSVDIASGDNVTWLADQAALGDIIFPNGSWVVEIRTDSDWGEGGDKCEVSVGGWDKDTGWYEIPTVIAATKTRNSGYGYNILTALLQTASGTIYQDDYLALKIRNNDSGSHTIYTNGRSSLRSPDSDPGYPTAAVPDIDVNPTTVNFFAYLGSSSTPKMVTITNDGNGDLTIGTITITGTNASQFAIGINDASSTTLPPGTSANMTLRFTPSSTGGHSATLSIPSDDPDENPFDVTLKGTVWAEYVPEPTPLPEPKPEPEPEPEPTPEPEPGPEEVEEAAELRFTVDFLGKITSELASDDGRPLQRIEAPSPDGTHLLEIEKGTRASDEEGNTVTLVEIREAATPPLPDNTALVGTAYEFKPSGTAFDQPTRLTLGYNVFALPEHVISVGMAYHTIDAGWTYLETESSVVAEVGKLTALVNHLTTFAILAKMAIPPPQIPAFFQLSNLTITPSVSNIWGKIAFMSRTGEEVVITVDVTNDGGQRGSYAAILMINGVTRETKEISLDPGQTQTVLFKVSDNEAGRYTVQIGDLTGEFISEFWINWWLDLGLIAVIILLFWFIISRLKRKESSQQATEE
jgi:hypothetical protein